jgi:tripeptidyl-peptidase-1
MGIAQNVPSWFVYTDGLHEGQEPFLVWIINMINTTDAPWVHSVSYGDYENSLTADYMNRVSVEFQKFGTMGRSILFASGDDGVGCDNSVR